MKKIIATVLAMVMALALCTTAFAANSVTAGAKMFTDTDSVVDGDVVATYYAAKAAKVNKDGEQTNTANIAYYVVDDAEYVVVGSLGDADLVLYDDATNQNVLLYLAKVEAHYNGSGKVFTNFGDACGKFDLPSYDSTKTYYTSTEKDNDALYVADEDGAVALMVNGKLVMVTLVANNVTATVGHVAVPTVVDGKVTGYTCSECKLAAVKAPNYASIPEGVQVVAGTNYYFPVAGATTTDTATSPKTFDAGIAMYVGMSLMSVAGTAVVIGKKKEF